MLGKEAVHFVKEKDFKFKLVSDKNTIEKFHFAGPGLQGGKSPHGPRQ